MSRGTATGGGPLPTAAAPPRVLATTTGSLWRWPSVDRQELVLVAEVAAANLFASVWQRDASPGRSRSNRAVRSTWFASAQYWDAEAESHRSYALAFDARPSGYDIAHACAELWERGA